MKVTISYSLELHEVREKIKELTLDSVESLRPHIDSITNIVELYANHKITSEDYNSSVHSFRKLLAEIDSGLNEVSALLGGVDVAEKKVIMALNEPSTAPPKGQATPMPKPPEDEA